MFYRLTFLILKPLCLLLFRLKVEGKKNIPASGPIIIAPNHKSYLDPIVVGIAAYPRIVHFMAKADLWKFPGLNLILDALNAFPVKRGLSDKKAYKTALSLLKDGKAVGIFPEGTRIRTQHLGQPHPGLAMIALKAAAPVIPVGVRGTEEVLPDGARLPRFPQVIVSFGEPMRFDRPDGPADRRKKTAEVGASIMANVSDLMRGESI